MPIVRAMISLLKHICFLCVRVFHFTMDLGVEEKKRKGIRRKVEVAAQEAMDVEVTVKMRQMGIKKEEWRNAKRMKARG